MMWLYKSVLKANRTTLTLRTGIGLLRGIGALNICGRCRYNAKESYTRCYIKQFMLCAVRKVFEVRKRLLIL